MRAAGGTHPPRLTAKLQFKCRPSSSLTEKKEGTYATGCLRGYFVFNKLQYGLFMLLHMLPHYEPKDQISQAIACVFIWGNILGFSLVFAYKRICRAFS
jgi:hypothetical protein